MLLPRKPLKPRTFRIAPGQVRHSPVIVSLLPDDHGQCLLSGLFEVTNTAAAHGRCLMDAPEHQTYLRELNQ